MYNCPNCSEAIGDDIRKCPFCQHDITDEERKRADDIKEAMHEQAVLETMNEYRRRLRNGIIITLVFIAVIVAGYIISAVSGVGLKMFCVLSVVALIIYLIIAIKWKVLFCPYCERMMSRGTFFRTYCPRCGGRLR